MTQPNQPEDTFLERRIRIDAGHLGTLNVNWNVTGLGTKHCQTKNFKLASLIRLEKRAVTELVGSQRRPSKLA